MEFKPEQNMALVTVFNYPIQPGTLVANIPVEPALIS